MLCQTEMDLRVLLQRTAVCVRERELSRQEGG